MLQSDAEGVIVCTATDEHVDVMVKLANAGKHIFTEKVMALSDEGAAEIEAAVKRNGVNFVISLPWKYRAPQIAIHNVAKSGELGKLNYLRFRNCHSGALDNWLPAHFYSDHPERKPLAGTYFGYKGASVDDGRTDDLHRQHDAQV